MESLLWRPVNQYIEPAFIECPTHLDAPLIEEYHAGDLVCSACGFVVGDRIIDVGAEWRTFTDDTNVVADRSRVGAAQFYVLNEPDLSTTIQQPSAKCAPSAIKYTKPTMSASQRASAQAIGLLSDMADRMQMPSSIKNRAIDTFNQVQNGKQLRGRSKNALASACLYIACRNENAPRSFKEICAVSSAKKEEIGKCFKLTLKVLDDFSDVKATDDLASRFGSNLRLPFVVQKAARHIARKAVELNLVTGKSPVCVAAAAVYMASQVSPEQSIKKTLKEVADVADGMAGVMIRIVYNAMRLRAVELFPDEFRCTRPIDELLPQL